MAWIAAIGLVLGAAGSASASKDAKAARREQEALTDRSLRIAESEEARANQLWREYQTTYLPRERQMVEEAFSEEASPEAAAARATADVRRVSANSQQSQLRNARRLGINPNSGGYTALETSRTLGEVGMEAVARDNARRRTRDENFSRQHSTLSLGRGLPATVSGMSSNAGSMYGSLATLAGHRLDDANQLQAAAGQQMGYSVGMLGDWYRRRQQPAATGGTSNGVNMSQPTDAGLN